MTLAQMRELPLGTMLRVKHLTYSATYDDLHGTVQKITDRHVVVLYEDGRAGVIREDWQARNFMVIRD